MVLLEKVSSNIVGLQLLCLLHLSRRYYQGNHGPPTWISGGTIYQAAMARGLHIDPSNLSGMSPYETEMRRRLWMTVLELQLGASLDAGTPPLGLPDDYDCEEPSNLDDDQLNPQNESSPSARSLENFTNTSVQILFGGSIPLRMKIVKLLNNTRYQATYGEILRLTSELEGTTRALTSRLASYGSLVPAFHKEWCELLTRRYFLALHVPYMQLAMKNPLYYFSRKVCVDNAIRLSYAFTSQVDVDPTLAALRAAANISHPCNEIIRLHSCTAGSAWTIPVQCNNIIAAELLALLREERPKVSNGVPNGGEGPSDAFSSLQTVQLHALLRQALRWSERRLRAGRTAHKDYSLLSVLLAEIEATMSGAAAHELIHRRAVDAFRFTASVLQEQVTDDVLADDIVMGRVETELDHQPMSQTGRFWLDEIENSINWGDFDPSI